jgi:hypothetical protein
VDLVSETFTGRVSITNAAGIEVFAFDSASLLLTLLNASGATTVTLDGGTGDIRLSGADCAEEFDVDDHATVEPGSVLTIGTGGRLRACQRAYDRRVAGVVSGGGAFRPGVILDSRQGRNGTPVALSGKVYCKVDAGPAPVEVGDLLTTSGRAGYAMKAADSARAFGATLGKALQPLDAGTGLIPVLVALH